VTKDEQGINHFFHANTPLEGQRTHFTSLLMLKNYGREKKMEMLIQSI
jgi:hypothetical protein